MVILNLLKKNIMLEKLKLKIMEKFILFLQKVKNKNPEIIEKIANKRKVKTERLLNTNIKKLILLDMFLETLYGLDSQILIDWHDKLNILSIDRDRK